MYFFQSFEHGKSELIAGSENDLQEVRIKETNE